MMSSPSSPRQVSENHGSPTAAATQSRRPARQVSSPWNQIVRGESESIAAVSSSPQPRTSIEPIASVSAALSASLSTAMPTAEDEKPESSDGAQGNAGKKPVWNRPSNGAQETAPVMGASSWPPLSETTKAPSNKSSSDSLKSLSDGSTSSPPVPVSQGSGSASVPAQTEINSTQPNPTPNHSRLRSFNRNGSSSSANAPVSNPPTAGSVAELPLQNPSPRVYGQRTAGFTSQSHGGNDNQPQRNSYRNQNGNHHQNHGGRRNQEHGGNNWNPHRSFNGREGHAQPQRGTPGFVRHAPAPLQPIPAPFMPGQSIPPYGSPVAFPEFASPIYYPRMPFIAPVPAPMYYHIQDPPLYVKIQNQIHFYFSEENLIKDTYLRQFMDDQGFVPIQLIASFRKMAELTDNIQHILDALQGSTVVEVQGDRIRRRGNWNKFLLPANMRSPSVTSPIPAERNDNLAAQVQNLSLTQSGHSGSSSQAMESNEGSSDGAVSSLPSNSN